LLDPKLVLERGFAWISDHQGQAVSSVKQVSAGQSVQATLADGVLDLTVKGKP
jgi:exodeoxyribonuclease VII large subunit